MRKTVKFKNKIEYNGHVYNPGVEYCMTTTLEDSLKELDEKESLLKKTIHKLNNKFKWQRQG